MKKLYAALFLVVLLLVATAVYVFGTPSSSDLDSAQSMRYFNDEIVLVGQDLEGEDFFLDLQLPRKESEFGVFKHFYSANLVYKGRQYPLYYSDSVESSDVVIAGFLKNHENKLFTDLSTRESYEFEFMLGEDDFKVKLNGLDGDFLTKNTPEYTRYLSAGAASVKINNADAFKVNAVLEKSYSSDYSKYVYFDGYDDLKAEVYQLVLFDEGGNFYLIDQSDVKEDYENYKSHIWVLYKNKAEGYLKKAFAADLAVEDGFLKVNIPDLAVEMSFKIDPLENGMRTEAYVKGGVIDVDAERSVFGALHYLNY